MSKLNIYLLIVLAFLLIFARQDSARVKDSTQQAIVVPTVLPTSTPTPTPTIVPPATLVIPKIEVSTPIEPVGTDENGKMLLPQDIFTVGWFSPGFKPGEQGNSVIAGHLDSANGAGAIFFNLKHIEIGDEIIIIDQSGKENRFNVSEKNIYPFDEVPIENVFGKSDERRINLITCTGAWNPAIANYSHRMIITGVIQI